jgi:hypothetical protein
MTCSVPSAAAQSAAQPSAAGPLTVASADTSALPDAPSPAGGIADTPAATLPADDPKPAPTGDYQEGQQTKRILFIIPNFRSVSVDAKLPPLKPKEKFGLAFSDSFDYSSFIYVGMLSGVGFAEQATPEFHQGAAGYARYYWHYFADNTVGNYFTEAIVPSITHEDPRYYTLGRGGFFKRTGYAISRLIITRPDSDPSKSVFNISEIVGNGAGAGISDLYYPGRERTWTKTGQKWALQVGLDGGSNIIKEFWPDVAHGLFHEKVDIEKQ